MCGNKVVQGGLTTQKEGWAAVIFPNVRMVVKERVCVLNERERERERERESESERESIE